MLRLVLSEQRAMFGGDKIGAGKENEKLRWMMLQWHLEMKRSRDGKRPTEESKRRNV